MSGLQTLSRRSAVLVLLTAAATMVIGAIMATVGARGGGVPMADLQPLIFRFELARSVAEVSAILGAATPAQAELLRATLISVNQVDFAFALAYPLLNVAIAAFLAGPRPRPWVLAAAALALFMTVGDFSENRALIALTRAATPDPAVVGSLQIATTVKWVALFLCAILHGVEFLRGRGLRRGLAVVAFGGAALGLVGVLTPAGASLDLRPLTGHASSALTLLWLVIIALAIARLVRRDRAAA